MGRVFARPDNKEQTTKNVAQLFRPKVEQTTMQTHTRHHTLHGHEGEAKIVTPLQTWNSIKEFLAVGAWGLEGLHWPAGYGINHKPSGPVQSLLGPRLLPWVL